MSKEIGAGRAVKVAHHRRLIRASGSPASRRFRTVPRHFQSSDEHNVDYGVIAIFSPKVRSAAIRSDGQKIRMRNVQPFRTRQHEIERHKGRGMPKLS
ncbi:MAG TPA: hypothetical protein VGK72_02690 [Chthoniobacterales bacterium]